MDPVHRRTRTATRSVATVAALALTLGLTTSCSTVSSSDLRTSGITASVVVVAGDADSQVTVVLSAGGLTSVELQGADRLVARSGTAEVTLDESSFLGAHTYAGELDGVADTGDEVTVALVRGDDDTSAPRSTVTLPGPIFAVQPKPGERVRRSRDRVFGVNEGPGSIRVEWTGSCVTDGSLQLEEGQPVVVPAGSVQEPVQETSSATAGTAAPRQCAVTFTVSRVSTGDLDAAYDGGSITAERSVSVAVQSVP